MWGSAGRAEVVGGVGRVGQSCGTRVAPGPQAGKVGLPQDAVDVVVAHGMQRLVTRVRGARRAAGTLGSVAPPATFHTKGVHAAETAAATATGSCQPLWATDATAVTAGRLHTNRNRITHANLKIINY